MPEQFEFATVGRLPAPGDNVAIATRRLEAGTEIAYADSLITLDYTVMEGHRFAVATIPPDAPLLSWGLPFGIAIEPIAPGEYVHNADMLEALAGRAIDFEIPTEPNFRNRIKAYTLDEAAFVPGEQVARYPDERTFLGYRRAGNRGVGTRNFAVVLGTSARSASYARTLAQRLAHEADAYANVDGISAVAHTEGDGHDPINNWDFLLRTLAGLVVHPNVGAILIVDYGPEQVNSDVLRAFMTEHGYELDAVRHGFLRLSGDLAHDLEAGTAALRGWLPALDEDRRTPCSLAHLNIALQCGGSDAFSGVSGNPLAGSVAKEVVRYGGRANLAETDELIGAEPYMLQNMRDLDVARKFLDFIAAFKERVGWHGSSAEGNPSGGNRYRGLYNIALKSIGAGMKRDPEVRVDDVVDYAEPMREPGFYFMNTPGNDLESIAGQVAGGSNMIFFVTGNGSITNFPFVPTLKLVTTTPRFEMLAGEMDVNAGAYQDGRSMAELTDEMLDLTVRVASGEPSKGEQAGHSQISIWRNWRQTDDSGLAAILAMPGPDGRPLSVREHELLNADYAFQATRKNGQFVSQQIGLILPTSLCSGQIARLSAERLNQGDWARVGGLTHFVALVHTEGCGVAMPGSREIFNRTMVSYMAHPVVRFGLFLEHGCEKTHNDYMRHALDEEGLNPADFGWASVQMDGGIDAVMEKIEAWFAQRMASAPPPVFEPAGLAHLRLGLMGLDTDVSDDAAEALAQLVRTVVARGGTVVAPENATIWQNERFVMETRGASQPELAPTLAYGQAITAPGLHMMAAPSRHWSETITGLGATGVELILAYEEEPYAGHPFVPVLRVGKHGQNLDLTLAGNPAGWADAILLALADALNRSATPSSIEAGLVDFQLTRGLLGVST